MLLGFGVDFALLAEPLGCKTPLGEPVEAFGVGVVAGFFEKNPRIDAWFLFDPMLEFCFFKVGGGRAGVDSLSVFFTILDKLRKTKIYKTSTKKIELRRIWCYELCIPKKVVFGPLEMKVIGGRRATRLSATNREIKHVPTLN